MSEAMMAAASLYNDPRFLSPSEVRIRNNKLRRQKIVHRQYMIIGLFVSLIIFGTLFMTNTFKSDAQNDEYVPEFKYYTTISVSSGDTLWNIANNYYSADHYDNIKQYMAEISFINNLSSGDDLKAGESLIIPYFDAEFR